MAAKGRRKGRIPGYGKVAVLMGGRSAEREVSLKTGAAVHAALGRRGVDAHAFDTGERPLIELATGGYDRAFIGLHGRGGEDGTVQGALESLGIPYTGSGVLGSALAMDKVRSKRIWRDAGLPTPAFIEIRGPAELDRVGPELGFPVMVKPVNEGSSCGATKVRHGSGLEDAWRKARDLDPRVVAETWITGAEYTAAVLQGVVLPMIRLETPREFYDYEAKYLENTTRYICPCGLDPAREQELATLVLDAFEALGATGWGRVDFMIDKAGAPWLIELNTVPGMTDHSLVPMAAKQAGMDFDTLVMKILETSTVRDGTAAGSPS